MKTLKQRFSMWFNKSRDRFGPVWSLLRCRVRYFTDGAIPGTREFVMAHLEEWRRKHPMKKGEKPRKFSCRDGEEWVTIHNFRKTDVS